VIGRVRELLDASSRASIGSDAGTSGDSPAAVDAPPGDEAESIDDYFDQLDAAFSNLSARPSPPTAPASPEIDWFGLKHGSSASMAEPQPAMDHAEPAPEPVWARTVPPVPASPPPQADDFAARLEVEQAGPPPATPEPIPAPVAAIPAAEIPEVEVSATAVPAAAVSVPAPAAAPVAVTDDLVAQISARVLLQLTDRVVRETVAEIAERLIRDEIERLKSSIQ